MCYTINKRELKKQMKSFMSKIANTLKSNGRISQKSLGLMIRCIHMYMPTHFMTILLFAPMVLCNATIIFLIFVTICFYAFDSCFLSIIEQSLCNDNFVIMDPLLELLNLPVNSTNRYYISNITGPLYLYIAFFIYYIRLNYH